MISSTWADEDHHGNSVCRAARAGATETPVAREGRVTRGGRGGA
jgi:hypothetical protein